MKEEVYAVAKKSLCDQDWKTQLVRGYVNIPENAVVKVIKEDVVNLYGTWVMVEYKGNNYYVSKNDLYYDKPTIDLARKYWQENDYDEIIDRYNKK